MWPVNMIGKMNGWPINSPISLDIVCYWLVITSSPEFYQINSTMVKYLGRDFA